MSPVLGKAGEHSVAREWRERVVGSQVSAFISTPPLVSCSPFRNDQEIFFFNVICFASAPREQSFKYLLPSLEKVVDLPGAVNRDDTEKLSLAKRSLCRVDLNAGIPGLG